MRSLLAGSLALVFVACGGESSPAQSDAAPALDGGTPDGTSTSDAGDDAGAPLIPEDPPEPLPTGSPDVTLTTFNLALIGTIKGAQERMPYAIEAINGHDADVICLQEVWNQFTSKADFAAKVATAYPYAYYSEEGNTALSNGVMILSKHPLYKGRSLLYAVNHDVIDYMVLGADVLMSDSYFHVLCTHLFPDTDAAGRAARISEMDELVAWATPLGYLDGPTFLLGDLNAGPDPVGDCTPITDPPCAEPDIAAYDHIRETFTDPNVDWQQCTWCRDVAADYQVVALFDDAPTSRIDHCMYRNIGDSTFKSRELLFDENLNIAWSGGVLPHISDHYGVGCAFGP